MDSVCVPIWTGQNLKEYIAGYSQIDMASKLFRGLSIFAISFLTIILLTNVSAVDTSSNFTNSDMSNSSFDLVQFASAESADAEIKIWKTCGL